jgi:hypothetical protein
MALLSCHRRASRSTLQNFSPKLTDQFSVTKLPTIIVLNQDSEQQRIAGPTSEEEISQMLDKQLGSNP